MTFKDPYEYLDSKVDYTLQILNNFCDSAIELQEIPWGKSVLQEYKSYCNIFNELRYNYYFQGAEASITRKTKRHFSYFQKHRERLNS